MSLCKEKSNNCLLLSLELNASSNPRRYEVAAKILAKDRTKSNAANLVDQTLTHYHMVEKIGGGGMGDVYRARDDRLGRDVAVKVLPAEFVTNPERKRRFIQEAKAASALNHPNIITVHEIANDHNVDFIVMEYVAGQRWISRSAARD